MRCAVALVCAGCDSDRTTDAGRADAAAPDAAVPDAAAVGPGMDDAGRADAAVDSDGGADDVRTADARTVGCWSIDRVAFSSATAIDLALTADGSPRLGVIAEEAAWIVEPADAGRWRTTRVGAVDTRFYAWITLGIDGEGRSHLLYSFGLSEDGAQLGVVYATDASGAFVLREIDEVTSGGAAHRIEGAVAFTEGGAVRFIAGTNRDNGTRFNVFAEPVDIDAFAVGTPLVTVESLPFGSLDGLRVALRPGDGTWATVGIRGSVYLTPAREGAVAETVRDGSAGEPSLAFDASGEPWVAFGDSHGTVSTDQLVVAHREGDAWVEEIAVPLDMDIGQTASVFDGSGALHVVFGGLRHAARASDGTWSVSTIGPGDLPVLRRAAGPLHLAYFESGAIDIAQCAP